jgi:hypothetical protein
MDTYRLTFRAWSTSDGRPEETVIRHIDAWSAEDARQSWGNWPVTSDDDGRLLDEREIISIVRLQPRAS